MWRQGTERLEPELATPVTERWFTTASQPKQRALNPVHERTELEPKKIARLVRRRRVPEPTPRKDRPALQSCPLCGVSVTAARYKRHVNERCSKRQAKAEEPLAIRHKHHSVYVVLLEGVGGRPGSSYYVGLTRLDPKKRFKNHKRGYESSRHVEKYGVRLVPELYSHLNLVSFEEGKLREQELAESLRQRGHRVYGGYWRVKTKTRESR
jgi:predicted GIY-YIG superfamily endonuclease